MLQQVPSFLSFRTIVRNLMGGVSGFRKRHTAFREIPHYRSE